MNADTLGALYELIGAAEDAVPVFDGLTNHGWQALSAFQRRERLKKALAAIRETLRHERLKLDGGPLVEMVKHDGGFIV